MKCPFCNHPDTKVIDSRPTKDNETVRRRRLCPGCKERFTTYERFETVPLTVVKKDNTRETFDREKIYMGMLRSCEKRPVSAEELNQATDNIEKRLRRFNQREVSSDAIGEMVMDALRALDQVAYVRFASVYREFKDVSGFYDELENLKD